MRELHPVYNELCASASQRANRPGLPLTIELSLLERVGEVDAGFPDEFRISRIIRIARELEYPLALCFPTSCWFLASYGSCAWQFHLILVLSGSRRNPPCLRRHERGIASLLLPYFELELRIPVRCLPAALDRLCSQLLVPDRQAAVGILLAYPLLVGQIALEQE